MDLLSSVRMPVGVAPLLVLEPESAALAKVTCGLVYACRWRRERR